jgi:hypothetical protein
VFDFYTIENYTFASPLCRGVFMKQEKKPAKSCRRLEHNLMPLLRKIVSMKLLTISYLELENLLRLQNQLGRRDLLSSKAIRTVLDRPKKPKTPA